MSVLNNNKFNTYLLDCAIEVHKQLGQGLLEPIYKKCFCKELELKEIPYKLHVPIEIIYKGQVIDELLDIDILVNREIVIEIAASDIEMQNKMQRLNSILKFSTYKNGIIINFNVEKLMDGYKRISKVN